MMRTVLIVEDQFDRDTLEVALLSIPDLRVAWASTGDEALHYLQGAAGTEVCALLTDLHMPRMDGFELIRRVRADERLAALPIIALSGDPNPESPRRALQLGANAFFAKPYSPARVRQRLEELLHG